MDLISLIEKVTDEHMKEVKKTHVMRLLSAPQAEAGVGNTAAGPTGAARCCKLHRCCRNRGASHRCPRLTYSSQELLALLTIRCSNRMRPVSKSQTLWRNKKNMALLLAVQWDPANGVLGLEPSWRHTGETGARHI